MIVREYRKEDFPKIRDWALTGFDTEYTEDQFPQTGFIVEDVAAIFLYSTDSKICFLENMISNRESDPIDKNLALDALLRKAFDAAKEKGFRVAYATTNNPSVIVRALTHGCSVETKHALLTKNLGPS